MDPSYRSRSTDDLCLGNTPNSWSPEESLLSRWRPVKMGARAGLTGAPCPSPDDPDAVGDSPLSEAGMGGESGRVEGVAIG
jgi:hypothetical protein